MSEQVHVTPWKYTGVDYVIASNISWIIIDYNAILNSWFVEKAGTLIGEQFGVALYFHKLKSLYKYRVLKVQNNRNK